MEAKDVKDYTGNANQFIEHLVETGYDRSDIFTKFVKGGKQVVFPVIGEDGRTHLEKRTFRD